ncbi:hypothetical protein EYC80_004436 [Monilinia laxa]|uniref:chitinase n=1 Tax=Monilinia laxa TaxID=61186 RepID=A0A5N6KN85_MONLA|nr:hypothetical protein EYC80_004436 [Monilinia laxa]
MFSFFKLAPLVGVLAGIPSAIADFDPASQSNIAVYWGQNSYGQGTGAFMQQRLSYYCENAEIDIIPLAFLYSINKPLLDFSNQGDICTTIAGSSLFYCSELEADITTCQKTYGKTILLTIGGATYSEGGFTSDAAAIADANNVWSWFGPYNPGVARPFGTAVIDGFDMDFEAGNSNMPAFANQLRSLMNANKSKTWILSAAPQCPYPDAADGSMLAGAVSFDVVWVQFYNNYCGVQSYVPGAYSQNSFNFETWDTWAKTVSLNPNVKIMLGIPANTGAGSGYISAAGLEGVIAYSKTFSSFGGVMMWDITQLYANPGYLDAIDKDLGGSPATVLSTSTVPITNPTTPTTTPTTPATTTPSSTLTTVTYIPPTTTTTAPSSALTTLTTTSTTPIPPPSSGGGGDGLVNPWNQCGGIGWNGGTICTGGTICILYSVWYSQCNPS